MIQKPASINYAAVLKNLAREEAKESFWQYRQYLNPKLKLGWFPCVVADALQQFYEDLLAGRRPKLVLEAPPQHGKSTPIPDFISWLVGKHPEYRTIFASFSKRLGERSNLRLQRIMDSKKYHDIFPTRIPQDGVKAHSRYIRNMSLIEFVDQEGSFRNTTVGGTINGESMDIGILDDPIKGRKSAGSELVRNTTWDWFTDDFLARLSEFGGFLAVLTRWHVDDPIGRLLIEDPTVKVLKFQAIAEQDEQYRKAGEALFPELKSLEFLLARKKIMKPSSWASLYQQNPIIQGGELIRGEWFERTSLPPKILYRKIFADTANKIKQANDYSVFQCWGLCDNGKIILLDQIRGKWEAPDLETQAKDFWLKHFAVKNMGPLREMVVEDHASGTGLIQNIRRAVRPVIPIRGVIREKDKLTRVNDVVSYIKSGYVCILANQTYNSDFIKECEEFTRDDTHAHDDQIDPMCDAIVDMLAARDENFLTMKL